jgi:hypothetical protein
MVQGSILSVIGLAVAAVVVSAETAFYNLNTDPYETTNIYDADDSKQQKIVTAIEERIAYWAQFYQNVTDEGYDKEAYVAAGGFTSWETSDFEPLEIEQKFTYSDAPHIVYVLVDDWGYNDLGSRSTYLSWATPTIDGLAANGVSLTNYYTNELCSPSRAALMTGRYAFRLGFQSGGEDGSASTRFALNLTEITLGQELQSAGYRTYIIGKWVGS